MILPLEEMLAYLLVNWRVERQSHDSLPRFIVLHTQPQAIHSVQHFLQGAEHWRQVGERLSS